MSKIIKKDEFTEYLKYALGEIILTILGIILALQVHTWNEKRINSKEIQTIIGNLGDEFVLNNKNFEICKTQLETSLANAKNLIELVGKKEVYLKTLNIDSLMAASFAFQRFTPSEDVISVLLETGNLKLITDERMRNLLYAWSSNRTSVQHKFQNLENSTSKLFSYLMLHYPLKDYDYYTSDRLLGKSNLSVDKYVIFQDIVFENYVDNQIFYMRSYLEELKKTDKIIKDIIEYSGGKN